MKSLKEAAANALIYLTWIYRNCESGYRYMCIYVYIYCVLNVYIYTYRKINIYKLEIRLFKILVNLSNYSDNKF
jgi:hypothetical protein